MEIYNKEHINKFMDKINTKKLTIFGLSFCGYTTKAKDYAREHKIPYKFYEIDNEYKNIFNLLSTINKINPDININTNHQTFPIIFYRNKFIGGYDEFIQQF
jgi:glutaredoxin